MMNAPPQEVTAVSSIKLRTWILTLLLGVTVAAGASAAPESIEVRELRLELRETKLALESRIAAQEQVQNILLGLLGVGALALPLASIGWLRKADRLAQQRLERIIESRPRALMELVAEHDAEKRVRQESRVMIVSEATDLEGVLRQHGFEDLRTIERREVVDDLGEAGAVILDLEQGMDEKQAAAFIEEQNLDQVLVFCFGRANLPAGRATFANSHMTLFSRLHELLKFKDAAARG